MLPVEEAQARILAAFAPAAAGVGAAGRGARPGAGRGPAARRDQPPRAVSAMDGYAVRAADLDRRAAAASVVGEVPAGAAFERGSAPGEAVRIFTGAPLPDGADAIVHPGERRAPRATGSGSAGRVAPGEFVRPAGLDFAAG